MSIKVEVVDDPALVCSGRLSDVARDGGQIVLAGGSTPRRAYELAAADPSVFAGAGLWFGDERCVGPDDERSNYRMVKEALLDRIGEHAAGAVVHRIEGELGPEVAADAYERELREAGPPALDLVLLGIGPDGHTASLFPHQDSLQERSRMVVGVPEAGLEPFVPRVTFTLPALARAQSIVFLVAGAAKAEIVERVFGPGASPDPELPSTMLVPLSDRITLLLDPAAAARL